MVFLERLDGAFVGYTVEGREAMSPVKQAVIRMIQTLPEESSVEDIIAELYFRLQVDAGLNELDEGKGIRHDEVKKRIEQWLVK